MNSKSVFIFFIATLSCALTAWAGTYTETGIAANDSRIIGWGSTVVSYTLGPVDITNPTGAKANFGVPGNTLGAADATVAAPYSVFSLGDGGTITIGFSQPIFNGAGADFAVFENGFPVSGVPGFDFLELAFVEVSSNGVDFFRFPSISLTQTASQIAGGGYLDPTDIHNLAGKDIVGFGTMFDLSDLAADPLLNINAITQIRLRDVVGTIDPAYATLDSLNNIINDPYLTNFNSGGFDLDAIGVLNQIPEPETTGLILAGLGLVLGAGYLRKKSAPAERT